MNKLLGYLGKIFLCFFFFLRGLKVIGDVSEEPSLTLWHRLTETCPEQPSFENFLSHAVVFGFIMLYFWLCDYQHIWPKTDKQYSRDNFIFIFFVLVFVAFVFTIKKTSDKILNRDQTEEWKGWMQVLLTMLVRKSKM